MEMDLLSNFIQENKHPLRILDVSANVRANSKGILILLRACRQNSSLQNLVANDSSIPFEEALESLLNIVTTQQTKPDCVMAL